MMRAVGWKRGGPPIAPEIPVLNRRFGNVWQPGNPKERNRHATSAGNVDSLQFIRLSEQDTDVIVDCWHRIRRPAAPQGTLGEIHPLAHSFRRVVDNVGGAGRNGVVPIGNKCQPVRIALGPVVDGRTGLAGALSGRSGAGQERGRPGAGPLERAGCRRPGGSAYGSGHSVA